MPSQQGVEQGLLFIERLENAQIFGQVGVVQRWSNDFGLDLLLSENAEALREFFKSLGHSRRRRVSKN